MSGVSGFEFRARETDHILCLDFDRIRITWKFDAVVQFHLVIIQNSNGMIQKF